MNFSTYREELDYQISHCPDCGEHASPFTHECTSAKQELTGPEQSQAWFEANTSPQHLTDTRTPADVRRQAEREGWK